jgi:hypothetical protein
MDNYSTTINALIQAVEAIEIELGIVPSGPYADVRVRLDILEARINNPLAPAPNVSNPFFIGNDGVTISTGIGVPTENRVDGSLYLREDGYGASIYSRVNNTWISVEEGVNGASIPPAGSLITGNVIQVTGPSTLSYGPLNLAGGSNYVTGLLPTVNQASQNLGGDLSGTTASATVIGLQNKSVSNASPTNGEVLTWSTGSNMWVPMVASGSGFAAGGDLSGTSISQTVIGIKGIALNVAIPTINQMYYYGGTTWDLINIGGLTSVKNITNADTPYTVLSTDVLISVDTTVTMIDVNLPSSPRTGTTIIVKDTFGNGNTNNISVHGNGNLIDGAVSFILGSNYSSLTVIFTSAGWSIV